MTDRATALAERSVSFGPFRLLPAQRILLEGDVPVRLGSRALDILIALVERAGELVSKGDLMARVWPDTFVDDVSLRVHVASLRRVLGDGQPGRRFLANLPGRGYQFVTPIHFSSPEPPAVESSAAPAHPHNLPLAQTRAIGRANTILTLADQLQKQRFVTVVGAGGIGKTTVALALAETLLPTYEHGVWFVDLAPLSDAQLIPSALASVLGVAVNAEDPASRLVEFLEYRQLLILLDNCEHVIDMAASLTERILAGALRVHILTTSREPLRVDGEHVHRLPPLESPASPSETTAAQALAFPAVQLFVERGKAIVDGFELNDADAPLVGEICAKLGGIALAIELAAARLDAFGVRQLLELLDDRFQILNRGRRTADPRHRSLAAALDWSYEFLPEHERSAFRRLSVFASAFTLDDATAVAGDTGADVVEAMANLVTKSLITADISGKSVRYRLLEPTRAYAMQKLAEVGERRRYARRHALYIRDVQQRAEAEWLQRPGPEWREEYGRTIDDVRNALNWAFSADGDVPLGVAIATASILLRVDLSLLGESCSWIERALASGVATPDEEMKLLPGLATALQHTKGPLPHIDAIWTKALEIGESLGDIMQQASTLSGFIVYRFQAGDHRGTLALIQKMQSLAKNGDIGAYNLLAESMTGSVLFHMGEYEQAARCLNEFIDRPLGAAHFMLLALRIPARIALGPLLWVQGFPERAMEAAQAALNDARDLDNALLLCSSLAQAGCPIALLAGDLDRADMLVATLLDASAKHGMPVWNALGQCWKGVLLNARCDDAGIESLEAGLRRLQASNFGPQHPINLANLAFALAKAGRTVESNVAVGQALEKSERNEELWSLPELQRVKGEIARLEGSADADGIAEGCFLQALETARRQKALSWELRAATSLARLWQQSGKTVEAIGLLSEVYDQFTEGFDTIDLTSAHSLIEELRGALNSPGPQVGIKRVRRAPRQEGSEARTSRYPAALRSGDRRPGKGP